MVKFVISRLESLEPKIAQNEPGWAQFSSFESTRLMHVIYNVILTGVDNNKGILNPHSGCWEEVGSPTLNDSACVQMSSFSMLP